MQLLSALVAGIIFGLGLIVSGMTNPAKVLNFLDVFGNWDASLAFVMAGAIAVTFVGYRVLRGRAAPLFAKAFSWPTRTDINARLISGAALFGIGWGLIGLCPGPALTSATFGGIATAIFVAAMFAGMWAARKLNV